MNVGDILKLCFVKSFFLDFNVINRFLSQNINFFKGIWSMVGTQFNVNMVSTINDLERFIIKV